MSDLAAFLTARLKDDEEALLEFPEHLRDLSDNLLIYAYDDDMRISWKRAEAELAAKLQIIDLHGYDFPYDPEDGPGDYAWTPRCNEDHTEWPCRTLRLLALPYADQPDYDESWRP